MKSLATLTADVQRLWEQYNYEILDTSKEEEFDDIVKLASQICKVPISLISLLETGRHWHNVEASNAVTDHVKESSFCACTLMLEKDIFEIDDASKDARFSTNPLVTHAPNIRFYAGVPLVSQNGLKMGTLCVINSEPQHLTDEQSFALKVLAKQVIKLLDLRLTNKELKAQELKMKQQSEMQNRIISIIAHDVRNPMASLKQIIEFTKNDILSEEDSKELMLMAETHLDDTLYLLSDLLKWGRMQVTKTLAETKPVNLFSMITENFCEAYAAATLKNNELINLVDRELVLHTDQNALQFIIRNLLGNAIKFTENGSITIYAQREGDKVLISVSDTGVGMEDSVKTKILTGDGKLNILGTKKEMGNGLGLLFAKDFIDALNGKVTIKSNKNKGTTFYIELKA